MSYDYKNGKKRIYDILNSKTKIQELTSIPTDESKFTYENGIRTYVGAMFVDMRHSTEYFKDNKDEKVARVMRAFTSEIITILKENSAYREIGIRGDCVYAIYSTQSKDDLRQIFIDSAFICSFQKMFQKILSNAGYNTFKVGIGIGCGYDLVIKAGKKSSGINDYIWIGDAVIDASNLSSKANTYNHKEIIVNKMFYEKIKDFERDNGKTFESYFTDYECSIFMSDFNDWIEDGMKDE